MEYKINGGKVLIIGDLHFSDVYTGKHKDYLGNCFSILGRLTKTIEEQKPSAVILLGDLIGWTETNIRDRECFAMFCKALKEWNTICPVYSVRGNHDMKGYPDFNFLSEFGIIINSEQCGGYVDYYNAEGTELKARLHLVDYAAESRVLDYPKDDKVNNIVLGHNNYVIKGLTNWYQEHDGIELATLSNFNQVDMVISGHIHNPSPEFVSTQIAGGKDCQLFYPGCPTRPVKDKFIYEMCWLVGIELNSSTGLIDILTDEFKLDSVEDTFISDDSFIEEKDEEALQEEVRKEALKEVLDDLLKYRMLGGDLIGQINNIPNASNEAKEIATQYLQTVFNMAN